MYIYTIPIYGGVTECISHLIKKKKQISKREDTYMRIPTGSYKYI